MFKATEELGRQAKGLENGFFLPFFSCFGNSCSRRQSFLFGLKYHLASQPSTIKIYYPSLFRSLA